jgi:hypothetical protein
MRHGIFAAGLLVGAAAACAIVLAMQPPPDDAAARPAHNTAGSVPAGQPTSVDAASDRLQKWAATILARPLFNPDRRPVAPTAAGQDAAAGLPRLSGIMITQAGRRAIFAATGAGKPQVVGEGGTVGGNLVQSITLDQVVLIGPDGRHSVHLTFDGQLPATAIAPPVPAGQDTAQAATPQAPTPPGTTPQGTTPQGTNP